MSSSTAANHAASFTLYWLAPAWIWSRLDLVHGSPSGLRLPHETATARPDFRFLPPALLPLVPLAAGPLAGPWPFAAAAAACALRTCEGFFFWRTFLSSVCTVAAAFVPSEDWQLACAAGDRVTVTTEDDGLGWVEVVREADGAKGLVPLSYLTAE